MPLHAPSSPRPPSTTSKPEAGTPEQALDKKIEEVLQGTFIAPLANDLVEEQLRATSSVRMNGIDELLEALDKNDKLDVTRRFCRTRLELFDGEPVTVLTVRIKDTQEFALPSANLMWNPVIPLERERGGESDGRKKVITLSLQGTYERGENPGMPRDLLSFELFSSSAPVSIVLGNSGESGPFVRAYPIFSDEALTQARHHAAQQIRTHDLERYSFIVHEFLYPFIREQADAKSWLVDSQVAPMVRDNGTEARGNSFSILAKVREWGEQIRVKGKIVEAHEEYPGLAIVPITPALR